MQNLCKATYRRMGKQPLDRSEHHHLNRYEFLHIRSNGGTVIIGDRIYPLCSGGLYLINADCPHYTDPIDNEKYLRSILSVDCDFADSIFEIMGISEEMNRIFLNGGEMFLLDSHFDESVDREFLLCAKAFQDNDPHMRAVLTGAITKIILAAVTGRIHEDPGRSTVDRAIAYIDSHLAEPMSVESVSEGISISKYHLCHAFRKKTGTTVMGYVAERRMSVAKKKLISTNAPIFEIARSCGFDDPSQFSRVFSRLNGISPKKYRKLHMRNIQQ